MILLFASILNVPTSYLFVHVFHLGLPGGAWATGSMYWLCTLLALGYIRFSGTTKAWNGWSWESLKNLWGFMKIVILGIVSVGAEWWAFEIIALMAGSMGQVQASAQSIVMSTDALLAIFPFGVGVATTNRVAKLLGEGKIGHARKAAHAASMIATGNGCIVMILLFLFRKQISLFFTVRDPPSYHVVYSFT